jgi:hypothetical protein
MVDENTTQNRSIGFVGAISTLLSEIREFGWVAPVVIVVSLGAMYVFHEVFNPPASGGIGFGHVSTLILTGLAAFLAIMAGLSVLASSLDIGDPRQPFGLPEGSVRAILTIAFIVLVGVLASYLVTSSDGRKAFVENGITIASNVTTNRAEELQKLYSADGLVSIMPNNVDAAKFDVRLHQRIDHRLSDDISKQILTMLSTILASMIGFYFGTSSSGSVSADPQAAQRASNIAKIERLLTTAPKIEVLQSQIAELEAKADIPEAIKQEASGYRRRLTEELPRQIEAADNARLSASTSPEDLRAALESAQTAVVELKAIERKLKALQGGG